VKYVLFTGALLMAAATTAQANPWDVVPPTVLASRRERI